MGHVPGLRSHNGRFRTFASRMTIKRSTSSVSGFSGHPTVFDAVPDEGSAKRRKVPGAAETDTGSVDVHPEVRDRT
jgi:hypothetical protein